MAFERRDGNLHPYWSVRDAEKVREAHVGAGQVVRTSLPAYAGRIGVHHVVPSGVNIPYVVAHHGSPPEALALP